MARHDVNSTVGVPPHEIGVVCARRLRVSTTGVRSVRAYSAASSAGSCARAGSPPSARQACQRESKHRTMGLSPAADGRRCGTK
jgi:hypothetical protein